MKNLFLLFFCLFLAKISFAQTPQTELKRTTFEPPKTVNGFKVRWATLSKGKYQEVFTNDTIQQIGAVLFNRVTGEVVGEVEKDSLYFPADVVSRWWSVDPLAAKYPELCPYVFVANNPIMFIDPDGRDIFPAGLNGTSYQKIFEGMQGNSVYQKYSKNFNNKGQDLYLEFSIPNSFKDREDDLKGLRIFARTYCNDEVNYSKFTSYFIPLNDSQLKKESTMITKRSVSDMHRAVVLIHEVIHAYIQNTPEERAKFWKEAVIGADGGQTNAGYNFKGDHEYMATNFVGDIEKSLREFAQQNNISNLSDMDFKALSWTGLRTTAAFKKMWEGMSSTQQKEMTEAYNKLQYNVIEKTNTSTQKIEVEKGKGNITDN